MAKALIDLNCEVWYVSGYVTVDNENKPVSDPLSNSARVCQIEDVEFDINTDSLRWVDCNTSVNVDDYYYDTSDSTIKLIPNATPSSE